MSPITDAELEEWERLCQEATEGPWYAADGRQHFPPHDPLCTAREPLPAFPEDEVEMTPEHEARFTVSRTPEQPGWDTDGGYPQYCICKHDADFIAAARTALPRLIAEVREMRRMLSTPVSEPPGEDPEPIL